MNVNTAWAIGERILLSVVGQSAANYTFKRSAQAVTLGSKSSVRIDDEMVQIVPQLLFQRLVLACSSSDDLESIFAFELCSYPTALFDTPTSLRQPQKPALVDAIWAKLPPNTISGPTGYVQYALDGGALLHQSPSVIAWGRNVSGQMQSVLQVCLKKVWGSYCGRRWIQQCLQRAWRSSCAQGEKLALLWLSQLTWKLPWRRKSFCPIQGSSSGW